VFDVTVVGNGIIGLSAALELARGGANCAVVGATELGGGSGAAAGILAPSVGERDGGVRDFFRHSLSLFPAFLAPLREFDADLDLLAGVIEVAESPEPIRVPAGSRRLTDGELRRIEPALAAPFGAVLHERDAAVDSTRVMAALNLAASRDPRITYHDEGAARIDVMGSPSVVTTRSGVELRSSFVVLAAGAWSASIAGLPRRVAVYPLKGQIISLDAPDVVQRAVMCDHTYLVPRGRELVVGATSERAGFDTTTTADAGRSLFGAAVELCPVLARARVVRQWAGLRPATEDLLPIIGPDPDYPSLIYACGHSRNGILLAPATAEAVRSFIAGDHRPHAATALLSISRFGAIA
jgi:glycine oxidase